MRRILVAATVVMVLGLAVPAGAAEFEVRMLNKGAEGAMVFEPSFLQINVGDTVRFVPTDKSHDAQSIPGMIPVGAQPFAGKVNEAITVAFDRAGVYGVKCLPHYGMGMVALISVGTPANIDLAKAVSHPGKAKQIFAALFERLRASQPAR